MTHTHIIEDHDKHFIIDPVTRKITPETPEKNKLVQYDHNSERLTFEIPRYVEGHDMSLCNIVQFHYLNISSDKQSRNPGVDESHDIGILSTDEERVVFSWLISRNATQLSGSLNFAIRLACVTGDTVDYDWHTEIHSGILVSNGIDNGPIIVEEYADILQKWYNDLVAVKTTITLDETTEGVDINVTDSTGIHRAFVKHGKDGPSGPKGEAGPPPTKEQIDESVISYMDAHPVQPTPIDTTLSKSGEAADAKTVGDSLKHLEEKFNIKVNLEFNKYVGGLINPNGNWVSSDKFAVSDEVMIPSGATKVKLVSYIANRYAAKIAYVNEKKEIFKCYTNTEGYINRYYEIPINAKYILVVSDTDVNGDTLAVPEIYFEKSDIINDKFQEIDAELDRINSQIGGRPDDPIGSIKILKLPKKFDLLVGDNFEMFYKGISNCLNSDKYDYELTFGDSVNRGKNWSRKWEWTPDVKDIGTHTLNILIRDNRGKEIDKDSVNIVVSNKPSPPTNEKIILCIGDSLTTNGEWCSELKRRLTSIDGNPIGYGLSNIRFIGTKTSSGGCEFEGYGGWTFDSYLRDMKTNNFMNIIGSFDKTSLDQHSIYKDSNGTQWKLETIEHNKIKIIKVTNNDDILPISGTLIWVSGGVSHTDIVYSSSEQAPGNPFWNDDINKNDFKTYAKKLGASQIDHAIILLGWNSTHETEQTYKDKTNRFINGLLTDFPDCKVTLLGLQVPSRNGFGNNYGIDWKYYDKLQSVWNFNKWYQDIADTNPNIDFVNVSGQFDTDYCMPIMQMHTNNRVSDMITIQSNGVHPTINGYYQISDAVLRNLCAKL